MYNTLDNILKAYTITKSNIEYATQKINEAKNEEQEAEAIELYDYNKGKAHGLAQAASYILFGAFNGSLYLKAVDLLENSVNALSILKNIK